MLPAQMPKYAVPIRTAPDGAGETPRAYIVKLVKSVTKFMVAHMVTAPYRKAHLKHSAQMVIITAMMNVTDIARLILITTKKSAAAVAPVLAVGSLSHGQPIINAKSVRLRAVQAALLPHGQTTA